MNLPKDEPEEVDTIGALETVSRLLSTSANGSPPLLSPSRVIKRIMVKSMSPRQAVKRRLDSRSTYPDTYIHSPSNFDQDAFYENESGYTTCAFESCKNTKLSELQPLSFVIKRAVASIIQIFPSISKQNDIIEEFMKFIEKKMDTVDTASKIRMNEFPIRICVKHFINQLGGDNTIPALPDGDPRLTPQFADCIRGVSRQLERRMGLFRSNSDLHTAFLPQYGQPQTFIRCGISNCPSSSLTVNPNALRLYRLFRVPQQNEDELVHWVRMLNDKGLTMSIEMLRLRTHICEMHFYYGDPKLAMDYHKTPPYERKARTNSAETLDTIRCVVKSCPIRGSSKKSNGKRYLFIRFPQEGTEKYRSWETILDAQCGRYVFPINLPTSRICERHFKQKANGEYDFSLPIRFLRGATYEFVNRAGRPPGAPGAMTEEAILSRLEQPSKPPPKLKQCCVEFQEMKQAYDVLEQKYNQLKLQTIDCLKNKGLPIPAFLKKPREVPEPLQRKLLLKYRVPNSKPVEAMKSSTFRAPSANEMPALLQELSAIRKEFVALPRLVDSKIKKEEPEL